MYPYSILSIHFKYALTRNKILKNVSKENVRMAIICHTYKLNLYNTLCF